MSGRTSWPHRDMQLCRGEYSVACYVASPHTEPHTSDMDWCRCAHHSAPYWNFSQLHLSLFPFHEGKWPDRRALPLQAASLRPPAATPSAHSHFSPTCTPASVSPRPCRPPSSGTPALCGYRRCRSRPSPCLQPPWWRALLPGSRPRCVTFEESQTRCNYDYDSLLLTDRASTHTVWRWWQDFCSRGFAQLRDTKTTTQKYSQEINTKYPQPQFSVWTSTYTLSDSEIKTYRRLTALTSKLLKTVANPFFFFFFFFFYSLCSEGGRAAIPPTTGLLRNCSQCGWTKLTLDSIYLIRSNVKMSRAIIS